MRRTEMAEFLQRVAWKRLGLGVWHPPIGIGGRGMLRPLQPSAGP